MIFGLNAWQSLLWIAAFEVISIAPICWIASTCFSCYFRMKENHYGRMAKAVGGALEKMGKSVISADDIKKVLESAMKKEEKTDEI